MTIFEGESGLGLLDVASADGDLRYVPADEDSLSFGAFATVQGRLPRRR